MSKEEFIKRALSQEEGKTFRYSHQEEFPPIYGPGHVEQND